MSTETTPKPSILARFGRFLLRMLFVIAVGIALGAGIYFGVLAIYRIYVQPVQQYDARLDALESRMEQAEQLIIKRADSLTDRLDALEIQGDTTKETLADIDSRLATVETAQESQTADMSAMAESLGTLQTDVSDLQTNQTDLQAELDDLQKAYAGLETLSDDLDAAAQTVVENSQNIETMGLAVQEFVDGWKTLQYEVELLKAMEILTRSRIFLTQGNLSLARAEIQAAANLIAALQEQVAEEQAVYLGEVVAVLNESLAYLPRSPLLAADRVEGAWQMLFEGLPGETVAEAAAEGTEPPTAESTPEATATPTP